MTTQKNSFMRRVDCQAAICATVIVIVTILLTQFFDFSILYKEYMKDLNSKNDDISKSISDIMLEYDSDESVVPPDESECHENVMEYINGIPNSFGAVRISLIEKRNPSDTYYFIDYYTTEDMHQSMQGLSIESKHEKTIMDLFGGIDNSSTRIEKKDYAVVKTVYSTIKSKGAVVGVLAVEYDASSRETVQKRAVIYTILLVVFSAVISAGACFFLFRRISNPNYKDLANTDHLTQLKNRNAYDTDLKNIEKSGKAEGIALIALDLNNLKMVNDFLGHDFGDQYIRNTAKALLEACDISETPYRTGGDEFTVIIRDASTENIENYMEKINKYFYEHQNSWSIETSVSMGYAVFDPKSDEDLQATFRRADYEMYKMKRKIKFGK